jgi:hypothetical protein
MVDGLLTVWTGKALERVRPTFEVLGVYEIWFLLLAVAVLATLSQGEDGRSAKARAMASAAFAILMYSGLRFALMSVLALETGASSIVWDHTCTVLSWLPLALILKPPAPPYGVPFLTGTSLPVKRLERRARRLVAVSTIPVLAGLSLAFACWFNDPGYPKQGRVLIDETHANWEWTQEPFDTTAFGIRAEYNYYCLRDYLAHFHEVRTETREISCAMLDTVDVLIIKTATAPYTDSEIEVMARFVERGGGLLLIGDHTNLFGMSSYLNPIAVRFGMRFRLDDTFDLSTGGLSTYERPAFWFHPAIRNLKRFQFLTSCTIEGDLSMEPVMVGYGLGSEEADYGHRNFFGNIRYDLVDRFGLFVQAGARRYGKGRVLLFTDSTCFSNFCMFSPGKPELILGFVDYLNRRGARYPHARLASLILSGALAGFSFGAARRMGRDSPGFGEIGIIVLAMFSLGTFATARASALAYGPIREQVSLPTVLFDTKHSGASFFTYLGMPPDLRRQQFEEFYMCAQRVGLYPMAGSVADVRRYKPHAFVIVNPDRPFSRGEISRLAEYVSSGGKILLLDSVVNSGSTANQVLSSFGMRLALAPETARPVGQNHPAGATKQTTRRDGVREARGTGPEDLAEGIFPVLSIYDAKPGASLDRDGDTTSGNLRISTKEVGRGRVTVLVDAFRYSASVVGPPLERRQPSREVRSIYREIFAIYERACPLGRPADSDSAIP